MKIGKRFEGKVAIVTASTQGIGFGIAERLGLEGASVVVSSRKQVRGCTRSLSIFGCYFIFWCNYALVHLLVCFSNICLIALKSENGKWNYVVSAKYMYLIV